MSLPFSFANLTGIDCKKKPAAAGPGGQENFKEADVESAAAIYWFYPRRFSIAFTLFSMSLRKR
jgi:hypothetical protein